MPVPLSFLLLYKTSHVSNVKRVTSRNSTLGALVSALCATSHFSYVRPSAETHKCLQNSTYNFICVCHSKYLALTEYHSQQRLR